MAGTHCVGCWFGIERSFGSFLFFCSCLVLEELLLVLFGLYIFMWRGSLSCAFLKTFYGDLVVWSVEMLCLGVLSVRWCFWLLLFELEERFFFLFTLRGCSCSAFFAGVVVGLGSIVSRKIGRVLVFRSCRILSWCSSRWILFLLILVSFVLSLSNLCKVWFVLVYPCPCR